MSWSRSLSGFAEQVEKDLTQKQKDMAVYALQQIITLSPVDTGTYRGNHRVTVNSETNSYDLSRVDKVSDSTQMDGLRQIGTISKPFGTVTIQNNLPYAEAIEFGHSSQPGRAVYGAAEQSTKERFN